MEPARAPSIEPPESFQGTRMPWMTDSEGSEVAQATVAGEGHCSQHSAASPAAGGQPVHLVFHRELTLDVPPHQIEEAVAAIVHMQPLPVSPYAASPPPAADQQATELAAQPGSPHGWHVVREAVWQAQPPAVEPLGDAVGSGSPGSSFHSAESATYPAGSSSSGSTAGSPPTAAGSSQGGQLEPRAVALRGEQQLHPTVAPPPRPGPMPSAAGNAADAPHQQEKLQLEPAAVPPSAIPTTTQSEGPSAPTPTPADTGSPRSGQRSGWAPSRSGPTSPATPLPGTPVRPWLVQQGPPSPAVRVPVPAASGPSEAVQEASAQASVAAGFSTTGSWPGAGPAWRQHAPPPWQQQQQPARGAPPHRRSRLAMGATASFGPESGVQAASSVSGAALPKSSAAEPQLTEIRGPWPPPPSPSQPIASPRAGKPRSGGIPRSVHLPSAFSGSASQQPCWRQLDDGSWMSVAEVDWYEAESRAAERGGAADAAGDLISCPLVVAASQSPPLSPVSTQLLSLRQPSGDLRRGPQRAASLGLSAERQRSTLSPDRQPSQHRPTATCVAGEPGTVPEIEPEEENPLPPFLELRQQEGEESSCEEGSGRASAVALRPPRLLPVLNTSPDVTAAGTEALSPFPEAGTSGSSFNMIGGLPLDVMVDKREYRHPSSDLTPREAYSEDAHLGWHRRELRTPLLAPPVPPESEAEGELSPWGAPGSSNLWSSTALLAAPLLGVGLLAAPHAFSLLGLVAGSVSLVGVALIALLSQRHLIAAAKRTGHLRSSTYAKVAHAALGPAAAVITDMALALGCFGLMAASFMVLGDILVGDDSLGLLGPWGGDRATVLAVLAVVVLAPLVCFRDVSSLVGSSALAIAASSMAALTVLILTLLAASQDMVQSMRIWPDWQELGAGGGAGWLRKVVEVLAVVPVLLVASLSHPALHPVVQQLRPCTATRARTVAATALLYGTALLVLLAVCCYALFGSSMQPDALLAFSPEALVSLAGDPLGRAAYLLLHLAFAVCLVASLPLLMGPFRDAVWRVLFWQPLLAGAGFYLVTLLALGATLWTSLVLQNADSLWHLLRILGATAGSLLALILPGLVAAGGGGGMAQRMGGIVLVALGAAVSAAGILRLAM